ncbi:MAG: hypothetical protein LC742_01120 [Acidobacteria bacterium]|nr:hypothetical protein [Acidobacteriota bacterium]
MSNDDARCRNKTRTLCHPDGTPGHFYLFDRASGKQLWAFETDNMSWAMQLSADASGIVAGSDNGNVYYFTPQ